MTLPDMNTILGTTPEKAVKDNSVVYALVSTENLGKDILEKDFESRPFEWSNKNELIEELASLSTYMYEKYKYRLPKISSKWKTSLLKVFTGLEQADFIEKGCTVHIYQKESFPIIFEFGNNTLIIAPRVED